MSERKRTAWQTLERGIRCYDHTERKHGMKLDRYFALRFKIDGKSFEEGLGWASEGMSLTKARTLLAELRLARKTGQKNVTLAGKREAAHQGRPSSKPDARNIRHSLERFGNKAPDQIRTAHIDALRRDLEAQGKASQTVKHILGVLRRIIRYGAQRGLCTMPDISQLHFDMPKVDNQKTECLTPEQAKALFIALDADKDQNLASMVRLALATGMRRGALLGLQWQDLDFQRGHIILRGEEAKNGKTMTIPMTAVAKKILSSIQMMGSPYLFPNPQTGKKRVEVRRFLDRIRKAANLPEGFRPLHGLRHTYASWLASSGKVDLFTLQKLMTHGSPMMTQRYAHLADEAVKRAASVIDDCLNDVAKVAVNAEPSTLQGKEIQKPKVIPFKRK